MFRNNLLAFLYVGWPMRGGKKNEVIPNDRAGMALANEPRLPGDVLLTGYIPGQWQVILFGVTQSTGAAELGPGSGQSENRRQEQEDNGQSDTMQDRERRTHGGDHNRGHHTELYPASQPRG
jgi:hypothetical protein